jgi:hypothetical protein
MVLDLVDVYRYYSPQTNSLQISTHNLCFEIYLHLFIFWDEY